VCQFCVFYSRWNAFQLQLSSCTHDSRPWRSPLAFSVADDLNAASSSEYHGFVLFSLSAV
jgi:hypothetical protein